VTPDRTASTVIVVGIYTRLSNDGLQRDASTDDQIRTCPEAGTEKGWVVDPALIYGDAGTSGASMAIVMGFRPF
jgi:hypothetical protein